MRLPLACALLLAGPALALPPAQPPAFAVGANVLDALGAMVKELTPLSEGERRSWQAIRAVGACEVARIEVDRLLRSGSYDAEKGELRWRECAEARARVP
jgi:hypothetical protein